MELSISEIWYNKSENEKKSAVITAVIMLLLFLIFWFIKLNNEQKKEDTQLVIDFAQPDVYGGANSAEVGEAGDGAAAEVEPIPETKPIAEPKVSTPIATTSKPVLTQNNAVMIAMKKAEEERKKQLKAEQERLAKLEAERQAQEAFKQKMNANFQKGKNSGGDNGGDGDGGGGWGGDGTSKNPGDGDGDGMGSGSGPSLKLGNRKFVSVVKPDDMSNLEGTIVIRITVDKKGNITDAVFYSKGSTTNNSTLVNKSIKAALQSKVTQDFNAAEDQFGFITYNYKNSQ